MIEQPDYVPIATATVIPFSSQAGIQTWIGATQQ